jgi:hypothetical protein
VVTDNKDYGPSAEGLRAEGPNAYRGDVIGWGPTRARWYSFCSMHRRHDLSCPPCMAGAYVNDWVHVFDGLVWKHARPVALWWHNRPNSKARRTLRRYFPGLRG